MLDERAAPARYESAGERGQRRAGEREVEDPASREGAADPCERPEHRAVILEEAVRHGEGEHGEQDAHEEELDAGGAREPVRVHALKRRSGQGYTRPPRGG